MKINFWREILHLNYLIICKFQPFKIVNYVLVDVKFFSHKTHNWNKLNRHTCALLER